MEQQKTFLSVTRVNAAAVNVTEQHEVVSTDHTVTLASSLLPLPAVGRSCIFCPTSIISINLENYICSLIFLKSSKSCKATASPSAIKLQLSAPPPMNLRAKTLQFKIQTASNKRRQKKNIYWMLSIQETNSKAELVGAWHWTYDSGAQSTVLNTTRPYCVPPY